MDIKDAEFEGGIQGQIDFLNKNLKYPKEARRRKIQGRVKVRIVVEKNGSV